MTHQQMGYIIQSISRKKPAMRQFFCKEGEKPCNETCIKNIDITLAQIQKFMKKATVVFHAISYEDAMYEEKETLTQEEEADKKTVTTLKWELFRIIKSFCATKHVLNELKDTLLEHDFAASRGVSAAITKECQMHIDRCKDCFNNVITVYIRQSVMDPYYNYLMFTKKPFLKDIEEHISLPDSLTFEDTKDIILPYVKHMASYAKNSDRYKQRRAETYEKTEQQRRLITESKRIEREEKSQKSYIERIQKFAKERERFYEKMFGDSEHKPNNRIIQRIVQSPNYDTSSNSCSIICALIKPETGAAEKAYYTTKGFSTRSGDIDLFYFGKDRKRLEKDMETCRSAENVKAVDSIRIY